MISMVDLVFIIVKTPRIDSGCSLEKEFIELNYINLLMISYLNINQVMDIMWPMSQSLFHISHLRSLE